MRFSLAGLIEPVRKWGIGGCLHMFFRWLRRHLWDGVDLILFKFSTEPGRLDGRIKPPPGTEMRFATEDELEEVASFTPFMTLAGVRDHIARGEECFIARVDGRIVYQTWCARNHCYIWLLDKTLTVGARAAYLYNTFTLPAYRDLRLMPASVAILKRHYDEQGLRYGYSAVDVRAGLALRAYCRLLGDGRAVFVQYRRRLCFRRYRCQRMAFDEIVARFDVGKDGS